MPKSTSTLVAAWAIFTVLVLASIILMFDKTVKVQALFPILWLVPMFYYLVLTARIQRQSDLIESLEQRLKELENEKKAS